VFLIWCCYAAALLLACAWLATRWIAIDWQTGTRLAVTLDQGAAIFVSADAPLSANIEVVGHDPDQVATQWWFAIYPHTWIMPLWVPMLAAVGVGLLASRRPRSEAPPVAAPHAAG
jgi:hypothetical protein